MAKAIIPTEAELETIRRQSEVENAREIRAEHVRFEPEGRLFTLRLSGRTVETPTLITFPVDVSPALSKASDAQLAEAEVYPGGTTLAIESLDLHLSVEALVLRALMGPDFQDRLRKRGARALGQTKSAAKTAAARENGKKGGRPRKTAIAESTREIHLRS
ncbi:MAG TPA: DUF2442 domain-containing protein [Oscillatoriaceae cyanobacterium]